MQFSKTGFARHSLAVDAAATPTTSKNQSGGAPALCEGKGGRERLRLNGEVGQLEADGPVVV